MKISTTIVLLELVSMDYLDINGDYDYGVQFVCTDQGKLNLVSRHLNLFVEFVA